VERKVIGESNMNMTYEQVKERLVKINEKILQTDSKDFEAIYQILKELHHIKASAVSYDSFSNAFRDALNERFGTPIWTTMGIMVGLFEIDKYGKDMFTREEYEKLKEFTGRFNNHKRIPLADAGVGE
jgi:hypothetical protein